MRFANLPWAVGVVVASAAGCAQLTGLDHLKSGPCDGPCDGVTPTGVDPDAGGVPNQGTGGGTTGAGGGGTTGGATAGGGGGGGTTGGTTGAMDAATTEAGSDGGGLSEAGPPGPCPGTYGPTPVRVGAFCIDSTEVTNAQYTQFLNATNNGANVTGMPAACSYRTTHVPQVNSNCQVPSSSKGSNYPVVCVDWCDAYAFCAWAGKRLCGAIGGGQSSMASAANAATDQWYAACSAGGTLAYPYGQSYASGTCNDNNASGYLKPVGSSAGCVGGYPGIYDLAGNAYEWVDGCMNPNSTLNSPSDACMIRGGAFDFASKYTTCSGYFSDYTIQRSIYYNDTGFRCCGP